MAIGFGSSKKVGRLSVEVAADMEEFDKDMEQLKASAKEAAEKSSREFTIMERVIRAALGVLIARIVVGFSAMGISLFRLFREQIQAALGAKALATVNTLANAMRKLGSTVTSSVGTAFAKVARLMQGIGTSVRGSAAVTGLAAGYVKVAAAAGRAGSAIAAIGVKVGRSARIFGKFGTFLVGKFASGVDLVSIGVNGLGKGLQKLGTRLREEGRILGAFGIALQGTGSALEKLGRTLGKIIGLWVKFKLGTVAGLAVIGGLAARQAGKFGNSFARVESLLTNLTDGELNKLRDQVARLGREIGVTSDEINETFYQTLSAMPQFANDAASALGLLEVALKVSATGFADGETAIRAITGIMNAWKLETEEAVDVANALFAAQNQGVTTFGEIAESIGSVTGLTSALGGEWRDLLTIVATVSPFIQTSEVLTGVSAVLAGVLESSPAARKEAKDLGLEFNATRLAAIGLIPFITEVIEKTNANPEIIAKLFGRKEASQLVITIAQNMEELRIKQDAVIDSGGKLTDVFTTMEDTSERAGERMKTSFSALLEVMGRDLEGVVIGVKGGAADAINAITELINDARTDISEFAAFAESLGEENEKLPGLVDLATQGFLFMLTIQDRIAAKQTAMFEEIARERMLDAERRRNADPDFQREATRNLNELVPALVDPVIKQLILEAAGVVPLSGIGKPPIIDPKAPGSLADSRQLVADLTSNLSAQSKMALRLTGDIEAYDAALESAQEQVNLFVLAERRRLIASGHSLTEANRLLELLTVNTNTAASDQVVRAQQAAESIDGLLASVRQLAKLGIGSFDEQTPQIRSLSSEYATLGLRLEQLIEKRSELSAFEFARQAEAGREIEAIEARRAAIEGEIDVLREMGPIIERLGIGIVEFGESLPADQAMLFREAVAGLIEPTSALAVAQARYAVAVEQFGKDSPEAEAALDAVKALMIGMRQAIVALIPLLDAAGLSTENLAEALKLVNAAVGSLDPEGDGEGGGFFKWLADNADTIEGVARGLLSVGDALGLIGDNARKSLQGVVDIASGITSIASGDLIGGITQGVGGLIGLASGLFGESAADKARRETLEKNTQALKLLTNSVDAQRQIVGGAEGQLLGGLQAAFEGFGLTEKSGLDAALERRRQVHDLLEKLKDSDLGIESIEDLQAALEELGISIQLINPEDGKAIISAFGQAADALAELQIADFFAGFEGSLERLRREFEIMDIDEASDQLVRYVDLLKEFTNIAVPDFDLSSAEGRAELEQFIRDLFAGSSDLTTGELDQLNIAELLDLLGTIEGLVDAVDGGPDAESFQEFKGITEVTANRLAGLLTTNVFWNEITAQNVRAIVSLLGGSPIGAEPSMNPVPLFNPDLFPRTGDPIETVDNSVEIGTLELTVMQASPDMDEGELATQIAGELNTQLGNNLRRQGRDNGLVTTRTAR